MKLQILFFAAGLLLSLAFGEFVLRFLPSFTPQPLAYVGEYPDEPHEHFALLRALQVDLFDAERFTRFPCDCCLRFHSFRPLQAT